MKDSAPDWFETCISHLTSKGTQRVWSVLVTIFGDLAQDETNEISGALITALTNLAGIKPEATRVALHRLRKEGWIESTRTGRTSAHRLTAYGREQSAAAAPRIYARQTSASDIWHVLIANGTETSRQVLADLTLAGTYVYLNPNSAMASGPAPQGLVDLLCIESRETSLPAWIQDLWGQVSLKDAYHQFWDMSQAIEALMPSSDEIDPMKTAILRVLIVHNWRRIILRHPILPTAFLPDDWKGTACRDSVSRLLDNLPRPDLVILEGELGA